MADRQKAISIAQQMAAQGASVEDIEFMIQQEGFKSLDELNKPDTSVGKNVKVAAYGAGKALSGLFDLADKAKTLLLGKSAFDRMYEQKYKNPVPSVSDVLDALAIQQNALPETAGQRYLAAGVGGLATAPLGAAAGLAKVPAVVSGISGGLGSQAGLDTAESIAPGNENVARTLGIVGGVAGGFAPSLAGKAINRLANPVRPYAQTIKNSATPQQQKQVAALLDKSFANKTPLTAQEATQSVTGVPDARLSSMQATQAAAGNAQNNQLKQLMSQRGDTNQQLVDDVLAGADDSVNSHSLMKAAAEQKKQSITANIKDQVTSKYADAIDNNPLRIGAEELTKSNYSEPIKTAVGKINADRAALGQAPIKINAGLSMKETQEVYQKLREMSNNSRDNLNLQRGYGKAAEFLESKAPKEFAEANKLRFDLEQQQMKPFESSLLNKVAAVKSEGEALNKVFPTNPTQSHINAVKEMAKELPQEARENLARAHLRRAIDSAVAKDGNVNIGKVLNKVANNPKAKENLALLAKGTPLAKVLNDDTIDILRAQGSLNVGNVADPVISTRSEVIESLWAWLTRQEAGQLKGANLSADGAKGYNELLRTAENPWMLGKQSLQGGAAGGVNTVATQPDREYRRNK